MAKVYISSTDEDLKEYRKAVYRALRRLGHDAVAMEDYVATGQHPPLAKCLADVADCDWYVGIFAWRYGYVPDEGNPERRSITELEYRQAKELGKPCFVFLLSEDVAWLPRYMDALTGEGEGGRKIGELRQQFKNTKELSFFQNPDELASLVSASVSRWEREQSKSNTLAGERSRKVLEFTDLSFRQRFEELIADKTKDFVGREYVFDEIRSFLNTQPKGYLTIEGDPGMGKSAILAKYVQDTGCIAHFNIYGEYDTTEKFLATICGELSDRYQLPPRPIPKNPDYYQAFVSQLFGEASQRSNGEQVIIAIDALDEVYLGGQTQRGNILSLPQHLPEGIYLIMTVRRDAPISLYIDAPHPPPLSLKEYEEQSFRDVRTYIENRITKSSKLRQQIQERGKTEAEFIDLMAVKSENNFMYLRLVLDDIENGLYDSLELEHLPIGLQGYYEFHWKRMGMKDKSLRTIEKIKIIYILAEVRRPVSVKKICDFSSEDSFKVEEVIKEWKQYLHVLRKNGQIRYSVYHSSFRDFLHRKDVLASHPITLQSVHDRISVDQLNFWRKYKEKRRGNRSE